MYDKHNVGSDGVGEVGWSRDRGLDQAWKKVLAEKSGSTLYYYLRSAYGNQLEWDTDADLMRVNNGTWENTTATHKRQQFEIIESHNFFKDWKTTYKIKPRSKTLYFQSDSRNTFEKPVGNMHWHSDSGHSNSHWYMPTLHTGMTVFFALKQNVTTTSRSYLLSR